jgi:hypothetical protein
MRCSLKFQAKLAGILLLVAALSLGAQSRSNDGSRSQVFGYSAGKRALCVRGSGDPLAGNVNADDRILSSHVGMAVGILKARPQWTDYPTLARFSVPIRKARGLLPDCP